MFLPNTELRRQNNKCNVHRHIIYIFIYLMKQPVLVEKLFSKNIYLSCKLYITDKQDPDSPGKPSLSRAYLSKMADSGCKQLSQS